ncbi:hypothetical protein TeGR_g7820 [Tetraparma gracilis]|uniref:Uncharacterized protein n=1 Tax=Tetraparma gracilis TaxID=2962635 RepID=A0ABQ6N878_9STRA|nr:hypothetical protein TeGR_g7820 [Tetraparma gracilis]
MHICSLSDLLLSRTYPSSYPPSDDPSVVPSYLLHSAPSRLMRFLRSEYIACSLLPHYSAPRMTNGAELPSMYDCLAELQKTHLDTNRPISLAKLCHTFCLSPPPKAPAKSRSTPPKVLLSHLLSPAPIPHSPLGSLLSAANCGTSSMPPVVAFLESKRWYDLFPAEYVSRLRTHLSAFRSAHPGGAIVEVAAGDGRLAAYLNAGDAPERGGALAVVATDDGSWGYSGAVEKLSVAQSLDRYCAEGAALVIVAWPPQGVDFTASFREKSSVRQ